MMLLLSSSYVLFFLLLLLSWGHRKRANDMALAEAEKEGPFSAAADTLRRKRVDTHTHTHTGGRANVLE